MSSDSTRTFSLALRKTAILSRAQQTEISQDLEPRCADARSLARQLLERGWLTSFQINQIVNGRGEDLILGPYLLLERLGEGGTGQVFKARHQHMNRLVALKLIRKELLTDQEVVRRFHREIQLVSALTHPNVVHAYDAGPIGANYFLVMEFVEGTDLSRLVKKAGPLPVEQACTYMRQAALGLQHIHERRLVHRDIKASNLLVAGWPAAEPNPVSESEPWGTLKILDLGLARLQKPIDSERTSDLTSTGPVMMGTLDYMAPEQALDFHHVDIRADIYSLGCTFYHLLTGRAPFPDGTVAQKLLRHQQTDPVPVEKLRSGLPACLPVVLRKMMAKRPDDRYQTPGELARLLTIPSGPRANLPVPVTASCLLPALAGPKPVQAIVVDSRSGSGLLPVSLPSSRRLPLLGAYPRRYLLMGVAGFALLFVGLLSLLFFRTGSFPRPTAVGIADAPVSGDGLPLVYLSDLEEKNFQGSAFGKSGFLGHNGNGNLGPNPKTARIIVRGVLSKKGVSMLAPSEGGASVNYRLNRQYRTFKAGVALHDGGWFSGSKVTFVLLGDTKVLWQSKTIGSAQDYPQECSVPVTGVDQLELQVTCTSSNNGVWPVWLDPCVSK